MGAKSLFSAVRHGSPWSLAQQWPPSPKYAERSQTSQEKHLVEMLPVHWRSRAPLRRLSVLANSPAYCAYRSGNGKHHCERIATNHPTAVHCYVPAANAVQCNGRAYQPPERLHAVSRHQGKRFRNFHRHYYWRRSRNKNTGDVDVSKYAMQPKVTRSQAVRELKRRRHHSNCAEECVNGKYHFAGA